MAGNKIWASSSIAAPVILAVIFYSFHWRLDGLFWHCCGWARASLVLDQSDPELSFEIGKHYFGGSDYDLKIAKSAYEKTLSINDRFPWAHHELARVYFVVGDFVSALYEINREIEFYPDHSRSYYVRGLIYGFAGDLSRSEADFKKFISLEPDEWAGYNDLAWIFIGEKKYQEAKDIAEKGLSSLLAGNNPWLLNSLGVAELNLNKHEKAKASFDLALASAKNLTVGDWRRAYPGNSPKDAESELKVFIDGIEKNIVEASAALN